MRNIDSIYKMQADVYEMRFGFDGRSDEQVIIDAVSAAVEPMRFIPPAEAMNKLLNMGLNIHELDAGIRVLATFAHQRERSIERYKDEIVDTAEAIISEAEWVNHIKPSIANKAKDILVVSKNLL